MKIYSKAENGFINVHPTFLYESILDFLIFLVLMKIRKKRKFEGQLTYIYFIIYGIGRAIIECLRADSLMFFNVRVSSVLSVFLAVLAVILYFFGDKCRTKNV